MKMGVFANNTARQIMFIHIFIYTLDVINKTKMEVTNNKKYFAQTFCSCVKIFTYQKRKPRSCSRYERDEVICVLVEMSPNLKRK